MDSEKTQPSAPVHAVVMSRCPSCDGKRTIVAFGIRYAPGHSGPPVRELPCHVCDGLGEVSRDQVSRMDRGERFRRHRVGVLGLGLQEAALQWGKKPSELSCIEQGKIETDWTPPGWPDSST